MGGVQNPGSPSGVAPRIARTGFVLCLVVLCVIGQASSAHAAFPGSNGKIAYSTLTSENDYQVESIDPDGTGHAVLFSGFDPAWSANGARLAFSRGNNVFTARPDGSDEVQVTHNLCDQVFCATSDGANYAPDGTRLVLTHTSCAAHFCVFRVLRLNVDGSGLDELVVAASDPAWSPDGQKIAFDSVFSGISTVTPNGGTYTELTDSDFDSHPSWSPDGTRIAFTRYTSNAGFEIYTMNADGTNQVRVTNNSVLDLDPAWSPDGSTLVYSSGQLSNYDLHTIRPDGTGEANITNTPGISENSPDWQPLHGPQRADCKNAAQFCKALREFLGDEAFRSRYGGGANAHGKCVSGDQR